MKYPDQEQMEENIKIIFPEACSDKTPDQIRAHVKRLTQLDRLHTQCKTYFVYLVLSVLVVIGSALYELTLSNLNNQMFFIYLPGAGVAILSLVFIFGNIKEIVKLKDEAREEGWK